MNIIGLIYRELSHRRLASALGVLSIIIAIGCSITMLTVLNDHQKNTQALVEAKEAATTLQMKEMEDNYRKITKNLGFNVLIIPKNQSLGDFYADNYASELMPESYVTTLAESKIMTVQHLLPTLKQKLKWPEHKRTVLLVGVRGEVPILHRDPKKPLLYPVPPEKIILGHELHASLNLKIDDTCTFMGRTFTVHKCYPERGNKDDITMWINLEEAQELLGHQGKINGIMALECKCAFANLAKILKEIGGILPDTQVLEFSSKALARAEARREAERVAKEVIASDKALRLEAFQELQSFSNLLLPLVIIISTLWIAILSFLNVRDRRSEIGLLRALGLRSSQVLALFLGKSFLLGLVGGIIGIGVSYALCPLFIQNELSNVLANDAMISAAIAAPFLCIAASWLPALIAAQQDPADILRDE
ncbi:MAG: FtsX-like permease family protein [Planctomycetes bacterium]|nr:FtsX-like permease family protein [Planctomycetota bacterium]